MTTHQYERDDNLKEDDTEYREMHFWRFFDHWHLMS